MFKNNKIMKKLGAGLMAGLCAFTMLGSNFGGVISARAESVTITENEAFPSADEVIAQAATLLGTPYGFGFKGFTGVYYQDSYKPLELDYVRNQGVDCSGLVYYTLTHLGYKTSGFSWNNPVPVDTTHWISVNDSCTISYGGVTTKVDVEKKKIPTEERPYWECADGSTITPGSVVVAEMPTGIDHAWIYMGEFDSRAEVVDYLKNIGVDESLITEATVGSGNGDGGKHWRIESNGSQGVVINNNTDGKKASAMNMYAYRITKTDVKFEIRKVDINTGFVIGESPVDNSTAVYGVYTDKACTDKVGEIKIGANGMGTIMLPFKSYYVKELKAPTGYALDTTVYTLVPGDMIDVPEDYQTGSIKINKTAEDGIVADREFKVVGSDGKSYSQKTNKNGIAQFTGLPVYDITTGKPINYTITEINVDTRYETPKAQNVTLTSGTVDLTVTANFVNELKTGAIRINKQSEDGQNGDRTFVITGGGETYTITTGADGIAILPDIPVYNSENKKIEYTISEKDVPIRYVTPADQTTTLTADATVDVTFENVLKKFTVEVTKEDIDNGTAQGDASLAGAVYGLYNGDELVNTYTTDENGSFKTAEYICGDNWTIKEISASEGYLLDTTVHKVGAEAKNYTIENNAIEMTVYEIPVKGKVSIIKHSDDGSTGIETPEVGAEFDVYLKSAGSFENAKESERDHLVCDENGFAETKMLPYGVYVVHQTVGWDNTEWVDDFEVIVNEDGKNYSYIINDAVLTSYVKIVKKDAETGNIIPVAGIGFKVWDSKNECYVSQAIKYPSEMTIDTFYTNETGTLMLPNELVYGDYELHEVQSANGYVIDSKPVPFTIDGTVDTVVVEKTNTAQKGKISVSKIGDAFTSVTMESSSYTDEDGNIVENPTIYTPVFEETRLAGAVFEITASEDIVTADGTIRAKKGDVVATLTTDANGYAESDLLYLGKYEVKEIQAPYGYVQNTASETVELTYAGQEIEVRDTVNQSFENDYQGVEITLSKFMEYDEQFEVGNNGEYLSVRFGLFADETITAADGTTIPENGLIAEVSLGEDMTAKFNAQLPFGRYYVQEIATEEHYMLNGEKYLVNFEYMGQEMTTVNIDCGTFENNLKRGNANGYKVNESDEPLENALFGLFAVGTTEFTVDTAIMTAISDENGYFEFPEIVYGQYIVKEIKAPTGYVLSNKEYPVTIDEDGDVVEITAENEAITVEISKQDIYGRELAGAEMQLINSEGNIVDEWTSDGTNHVISELAVGKYTLKEIAAPDGYIIATDISFEVFKDGSAKVENVEATATTEDGHPLVVMVDDTTKVEIWKLDITNDEELIGATLQLIDENGVVVEEWVSYELPHFIEAKLIAGKTYTLKETAAPDGYQIANSIEFTVNEDGTANTVVMYDEPIPDTPDIPTGDTTSRLPGALMIMAGLAIVVILSISRKKKDIEVDEYAALCPDFIESEE
ncbi:MAG: Cna B-type domain-containing protein [Oscillospiraceae bacterium]|nr:Cna B-type domain-containing protein [Oscillospiraceae bacterium]